MSQKIILKRDAFLRTFNKSLILSKALIQKCHCKKREQKEVFLKLEINLEREPERNGLIDLFTI